MVEITFGLGDLVEDNFLQLFLSTY